MKRIATSSALMFALAPAHCLAEPSSQPFFFNGLPFVDLSTESLRQRDLADALGQFNDLESCGLSDDEGTAPEERPIVWADFKNEAEVEVCIFRLLREYSEIQGVAETLAWLDGVERLSTVELEGTLRSQEYGPKRTFYTVYFTSVDPFSIYSWIRDLFGQKSSLQVQVSDTGVILHIQLSSGFE